MCLEIDSFFVIELCCRLMVTYANVSLLVELCNYNNNNNKYCAVDV